MRGSSRLGDLSKATAPAASLDHDEIAIPLRFPEGVLGRSRFPRGTAGPCRIPIDAAGLLDGRRHFLIVNGPFGPFTRRLAQSLRHEGAQCFRVVLNGGDLCDWGIIDAKFYFGSLARWHAWLAQVIRRDGVTDLILYGDTSPYCADAKRVATELGLAIHVLEQGYFRPFWITLERNGVNGTSMLHRSPAAYFEEAKTAERVESAALQPLTPWAVYRISAYHLSLYLTCLLFLKYRTPYAFSAPRQMVGHVRRYANQKLNRTRNRRRLRNILEGHTPIFLVLLQRPGDSQLLRHSRFPDAASFAREVIGSFARYAPANARLLFKSHPLDHGLESHEKIIGKAAASLAVSQRVYFTDVGELDDILPFFAGAVTVNSTAGLNAIALGCPTVALGRAIYDLPGLTHQSGLDRFWRDPEPPDTRLYDAFRRVVMARTQVNGAYASPEGIELAAPGVARRLLASSLASPETNASLPPTRSMASV